MWPGPSDVCRSGHWPERLRHTLEESGEPACAELCEVLQEMLSGAELAGRVVGLERLKPRVYRVQMGAGIPRPSLVVKRLDPTVAQRNRLVADRWLPGVELADACARLLGAAADRHGRYVWHVYEDLGDDTLAVNPVRQRVAAAVDLIADLHTRATGHLRLSEIRHYSRDLGIHYFISNVRDAIAGLKALPGHPGLRARLLERLHKLLAEAPMRAQVMEEVGGPDTFLHGDLWTSNALVTATPQGMRVRLIDWDHVGVGPFSYDLSTFLYRFPPGERPWILERYGQAVGRRGWHLPAIRELNLLFDTAECARYANRIIWPAMALLHDRAEWGLAELAEVEQWFETLGPVLPPDGGIACDRLSAIRPLDSVEAPQVSSG